jgi:hypothetical protein
VRAVKRRLGLAQQIPGTGGVNVYEVRPVVVQSASQWFVNRVAVRDLAQVIKAHPVTIVSAD